MSAVEPTTNPPTHRCRSNNNEDQCNEDQWRSLPPTVEKSIEEAYALWAHGGGPPTAAYRTSTVDFLTMRQTDNATGLWKERADVPGAPH